MSDETKTKAEAEFGDTIANNRSIAVVAADQFPKIPTDFKASSGEIRRTSLRKLDKDLLDELLAALAVCNSRGATMSEDLGKKAPPAEKAGELYQRLTAVQGSLSIAVRLVDYLKEVEDIAIHDSVLYLEAVKKLYDINVEDPNLAATYEKVNALFKARSAKISEGIAAKKP
jgi:hypothetical protein